MKYEELFERYRLLLRENERLTEENKRLEVELGIREPEPTQDNIIEIPVQKDLKDDASNVRSFFSPVNNTSDTISKIKLFMSLFKGRDDVYGTRWENEKRGTSGYSPVCLNK